MAPGTGHGESKMVMEPDDQGFIPSIHNYCDRWCERCPFTSRCRAYAMEMTIRIDGFDGELARADEREIAAAHRVQAARFLDA